MSRPLQPRCHGAAAAGVSAPLAPSPPAQAAGPAGAVAATRAAAGAAACAAAVAQIRPRRRPLPVQTQLVLTYTTLTAWLQRWDAATATAGNCCADNAKRNSLQAGGASCERWHLPGHARLGGPQHLVHQPGPGLAVAGQPLWAVAVLGC